jgi:C4-dicarboxylate-specific signal transduction histidine kinase
MAFNESTSDWSRSLSRGQRVRFHALPVGQQIARITNEQPVVLITGALTAWAAQTEMNLMTARRSHFDEVYPTKAQLARIARLTMMAELAASIAHEISDPLCAVVTSAEACLRWLNRDEPDLDEARRGLEHRERRHSGRGDDPRPPGAADGFR